MIRRRSTLWLGALVLLLLTSTLLPESSRLQSRHRVTVARPLPFAIGMTARVETSTNRPNNVRSGPGTSNPVVEIAQPGAEFAIVGGPICANGYNWWQVRLASGNVGWMAEGVPGEPWIEAVGGSAGGVPDTNCATALDLIPNQPVYVTETGDGAGNHLREQPGLGGTLIATVPAGAILTVLGGPSCYDGYNWWQVRLNSVTTGWMAEGTPGDAWIAPTGDYSPGSDSEAGDLGGSGDPGSGSSSDCAAALAFSAGMSIGVPAARTQGTVMHQGPALTEPFMLVIPSEDSVTVVGGPACDGQYNWWQVRLSDGQTGWMPEGLPGNYWLEERAGGGDPGGGTSGGVLPGPPGLLPADMRPLYLLTWNNDGTLGSYRSQHGWQPFIIAAGTYPTASFAAGGAQAIVVLNEALQIWDIETGIMMRHVDWQMITGDNAMYFTAAYATQTDNVVLAYVSERREAFPRTALYRIDFAASTVDELFGLDEWVSLQGPPGEPPRFAVTPTAIYPITPDGRLGAAIHNFSTPLSYSEAPFMPTLIWGAGNVAYLGMAQGPENNADIVVWMIEGSGTVHLVTEVFRMPGLTHLDGLFVGISPTGEYIALSISANNEWLIYQVSGPTLSIVGQYPSSLNSITFTPDGAGFLAREGGGGFQYYALRGGATSPWLPNAPDLVDVIFLADGTAVYRQVAGGVGRLIVQRPGLQPFSLDHDMVVRAALLGTTGP